MHTHAQRIIAIISVGYFVAWTSGCSRCSDDGVPTAEEVAGSAALPWEAVTLGVDQAKFVNDLAEMAGITAEEAQTRIRCGDQFTMDVIDPGEREIAERSGRGHSLGNCTLQQASSDRSWSLASARGELVDGKLVRVTFAFFGADQHGILARELRARFGPGASLELEERSAVLADSEPRDCTLWKRAGELIALIEGAGETRLIRQDLDLTGVLLPMPEAAERGEPVDLKDIGLGGGLDLDAPLPSVDGLVGGDH
jgi:hypothetical protein